MIKRFRILWALVLSLGIGYSASAQHALFLLAPASVVGVQDSTISPSGTGWGLGDSLLTKRARGFCQFAFPDSLALNAANVTGPNGVGNLTGKIAVVYRGTVTFGEKIARCQRAGAVGVIIINDNRVPPASLGSADTGIKATIPCIFVQRSWARRFRSLVRSGQLEAQIGNVRGTFPNNLAIQLRSCFIPDHYAIPRRMVRDSASFSFPIGASVSNFGSAFATSATIKAVINRVSPTFATLFNDSITVTGVDVNDSISTEFPTRFNLFRAENGVFPDSAKYELVYTVRSSSGPDEFPKDNRRVFDFHLTSNFYSKSRLNMDPTSSTYKTPITNGGLTISGGGAFKWGHFWRPTRNLDGGILRATAKAITFAATTNNTAVTDSLGGQSVAVELIEWVDVNADSVIQLTEVTTVASGEKFFTNNRDRGVFFTVELFDVNSGSAGYNMIPGRGYMIMGSYQGTDLLFLQSISDDRDYTRNFLPANVIDPYLPLITSSVSRFANQAAQPSLRLDMDIVLNGPIATNSLAGGSVTALKLFPNPAENEVFVAIEDRVGAGNAIIAIRDLAGRTVATQTAALTGTNTSVRVNLANTKPGMYTVEVVTNGGRLTRKMVVR